MKPALQNLGMTDEWLTNAADKLEKDAERNDGGDSALYKLGHGSADQKRIVSTLLYRSEFHGQGFCRRYSAVVTLTITRV